MAHIKGRTKYIFTIHALKNTWGIKASWHSTKSAGKWVKVAKKMPVDSNWTVNSTKPHPACYTRAHDRCFSFKLSLVRSLTQIWYEGSTVEGFQMQIWGGKQHTAEGDGCAGEGIFSFSVVKHFMNMSKCDVLVMLVRVAHVVLNSLRDNLLQQAVLFFFTFFF